MIFRVCFHKPTKVASAEVVLHSHTSKVSAAQRKAVPTVVEFKRFEHFGNERVDADFCAQNAALGACMAARRSCRAWTLNFGISVVHYIIVNLYCLC
jgi:hypothetical protein